MNCDRPLEELLEEAAVINFKEYLRYNSVPPQINYNEIFDFLKLLAADLRLIVNEFDFLPKKPMLMLTWPGNQSGLKSILLLSHMDVSPVDMDRWTHDPFTPHIDADGNIFARGTQGSKCVGIQYLEAIKILKREHGRLLRTIHILFLPEADLETGDRGTYQFIKSMYFDKCDIGFVIEEGMATSKDNFTVFVGERACRRVRISCRGYSGPGAVFLPQTTGKNFTQLLGEFYKMRREELNKLILNDNYTLGDITSVNVTMVDGGIARNVIPYELTMTLDFRIPVTLPLYEFEDIIHCLCSKTVGQGNFTIEYINRQEEHAPLVKQYNRFLLAFIAATDKLKLRNLFGVMPNITDGKLFRLENLPVVGFSPINKTAVRDHNEFINVKTFLKGIDVYVEILRAVGNVATGL